MKRLILAAAMMALAACSSGSDSPNVGGAGVGDRSDDASAQLACRAFYDLAADADLLTFPEQRERIQDIWNYAEVSEAPGIPGAARAMLEAITARDFTALDAAVGSMDSACSRVEPL